MYSEIFSARSIFVSPKKKIFPLMPQKYLGFCDVEYSIRSLKLLVWKESKVKRPDFKFGAILVK